MTITYSLWQGSQLLSVGNKANNPEEILAVIAELNKLGKGFTFNVREVNTNEQTTNYTSANRYWDSRPFNVAPCHKRFTREWIRLNGKRFIWICRCN